MMFTAVTNDVRGLFDSSMRVVRQFVGVANVEGFAFANVRGPHGPPICFRYGEKGAFDFLVESWSASPIVVLIAHSVFC